jgi:hypothetical protein
MGVVKVSTELTLREAGRAVKVSHEWVRKALAVVEYAPELADPVLRGS